MLWCVNQCIALLYAYKVSNNEIYLNVALGNLDYLLGRNGTDYSFVKCKGVKTPIHPHHRPSEADGIDDPILGLLVGGRNPGMQDKCYQPTTIADEAYIDDSYSDASNEIAINQNTSLVYFSCILGFSIIGWSTPKEMIASDQHCTLGDMKKDTINFSVYSFETDLKNLVHFKGISKYFRPFEGSTSKAIFRCETEMQIASRSLPMTSFVEPCNLTF